MTKEINTWNFRLATKYLIFLITLMAVLCASVNLKRIEDLHDIQFSLGKRIGATEKWSPKNWMFNTMLITSSSKDKR